MKVPGVRIIKAAYCLIALAFHWALFFTNAGNYFHGGTPGQWIALQSVAALIVVAAVRFARNAPALEKILVMGFATVPAVCLAWTLIDLLRR